MHMYMLIHIHYFNMFMYLITVYHVTYVVPPMTAPILMKPTDLTRTSFTITWTIANSDNIYSYIITWTNLLTGDTNMTVLENTDSYEVTGLNGYDNYNVSVTTKNKCGMMESDPITVYGKDVI